MLLNVYSQHELTPGVLCASLGHEFSLIFWFLENDTSALMYVYAAAYVDPYKHVEWVSCSQSNSLSCICKFVSDR